MCTHIGNICFCHTCIISSHIFLHIVEERSSLQADWNRRVGLKTGVGEQQQQPRHTRTNANEIKSLNIFFFHFPLFSSVKFCARKLKLVTGGETAIITTSSTVADRDSMQQIVETGNK
ncbi:hypothetical protein Tsp_02701 [Trichinella spiralis]|uniref:hypothetical protein n=1 Tax=Trichinella spiralis TaxID=6334 RepID=UPI0001EFBF87|nr:hypothetical protein Tsp_02701 [Trichinella spiralis]